jgi:DUF917 family protein
MIAASPDVIAVLDAHTLEPLTTLGDVAPGRTVIAVQIPPVDAAWLTARGRALLGPQCFGFQDDCLIT